MSEKKLQVCTWVGAGEGCRHPTIYGKAYCDKHYGRMYEVYFPEMADYVIEKDLNANKTLAKFEKK